MALPRLVLAPAQWRRIRELAEAAWPHEACGLVEGTAGPGPVRVAAIHRLANVHAEPDRRYTIDPEAFLRLEHAARARGRAIVGVWHSHPHGEAAPSPRDLEGGWPGWSYLIAGVTKGRMIDLRCWRLAGDDFAAQAVGIFPGPR